MNRRILIDALTAMGYRNMNDGTKGNYFGKPIGFGIIICNIKDDDTMEMSTMFQLSPYSSEPNKLKCWDSKDIDIRIPYTKDGVEYKGAKLYDWYCARIAYNEFLAHANKVIEQSIGLESNQKTLAFLTIADKFNNFNI